LFFVLYALGKNKNKIIIPQIITNPKTKSAILNEIPKILILSVIASLIDSRTTILRAKVITPTKANQYV